MKDVGKQIVLALNAMLYGTMPSSRADSCGLCIVESITRLCQDKFIHYTADSCLEGSCRSGYESRGWGGVTVASNGAGLCPSVQPGGLFSGHLA